MKRVGFIGLLGCVAFAGLRAETGPPVDVGSRAKGAQQVVVATIVDVKAAFDVSADGDQLIVSRALLQVSETMKGAHAAALEVEVEGGTIGDLTLDVSDMPTVERGQRAVLFLNRTSSGSRTLHGRGLGFLKLDQNDRVEGTDLTVGDIRRAVREAGE